MRKIATAGLILGLVLLIGAAMLAIDGFATEDRRMALNSAVGDFIDEQAEQDTAGRTGRTVTRIFQLIKGVKESGPRITAEAILPPAPEGWERLAYTDGHGLAITGKMPAKGILAGHVTTQMLDAFSTSANKSVGDAAASYARGDALIAVRIEARHDQFDHIGDKGAYDLHRIAVTPPKPNPWGKLFAEVDGIKVIEMPAVENAPGGKRVEVSYRRFNFHVGKLVMGEIITTAGDAEVLALLSAVDIAAIQEAAGARTMNYRRGSGVIAAADMQPGPSDG